MADIFEDDMEITFGRILGMSLIAIVLGLGLTWAIQGNEFYLYKVFAPKQEEVRREVFEQTKSYRQGTIQELQNMEFEYLSAKPEAQAALADIILHRAADYTGPLPPDLQQFISKLKETR